MNARWSALLLFASGLFTACGTPADGRPPTDHDVRLAVPRSLLPAGGELIGYPSDIDVDPAGRLWIADQEKQRILMVDPESGETRVFGRPGWDAGELMVPMRIQATDSLVRVFDRANSRVQSYRPDGTHVGDRVIRDLMVMGAALMGDGRLVIGTAGEYSALARVFGEEDTRPFRVGEAVVEFRGFDLPFFKTEIAAGRVPEVFRNMVVPVPGRGDAVWLLLHADGEVRRYAPDGELIWARTLDVPEIARARREFFRRNAADKDPLNLIPLHTMAAGREVGDRLWVLMQAEAGSRTAVFYTLDRESGEILSRLSVRVPDAVNGFAVDHERGVLYLSVPSRADVLAVDVGDELRR
jgi:hypothetical protein